MTNPTMAAEVQKSRRAALSLFAGLPVLAALPAAAMMVRTGAEPDAELIDLGREIHRLIAASADITEKRIAPFQEEFYTIRDRDADRLSQKERLAAALAYHRENGVEAAIAEEEKLFTQAVDLWERLLSARATTQAGRSAKVRAFLVLQSGDDWHGPDEEMEWDKSMARSLLGDFAGMSADELAAI
jgi:hypothetical protein